MMQCSAQLRSKPRWFEKIRDAGIVDRWTREALAQGLTEAQVRYVIDELAHYAALRDEETGAEVSAVDGVWQSDTLVDDRLRQRLREAVRVLEEVPEEERDWHPGSDGQVLDLVHPSLFCLVREVSGVSGRAWENPTDSYSRYEFSEKFQWLPTDADVDDDGRVGFRSYVNNVHPEKHRDLVEVLPELVARMVPLWENVLSDLRCRLSAAHGRRRIQLVRVRRVRGTGARGGRLRGQGGVREGARGVGVGGGGVVRQPCGRSFRTLPSSARRRCPRVPTG